MTAIHDHSDVTEGQSSHLPTTSRFGHFSEPLTANMNNSKSSTPIKPKPNLAPSVSPNSVVSNFQSIEQSNHLAALNYQQPETIPKDAFLLVQVESSIQNTAFYVPVSLMLQREVDMQKAAHETRTSVNRWSGSLLYNSWMEGTEEEQEGGMTLWLTPEVAMQSYSKLEWRPWMTTCIRAYYNNGTIRVPEQCIGPDILMALEYFGILTSNPSTFIVESRHALDRIKAWTTYFAYRNSIADWVVKDYRTRKQVNRVWITTPDFNEMNRDETLLQVDGETACVLRGGLDHMMAINGRQSTSGEIIHEIFDDNESENHHTKKMPSRIRQDFCRHLERRMTSLCTSFDIDQVKTTDASGHVTIASWPVLRVWRVDCKDGGWLSESHSSHSRERLRGQPESANFDDKRRIPKNVPSRDRGRDHGLQHIYDESNDTKDLLSYTQGGMPVGCVNTAFGDLQSVTSALSDPHFDESTIGNISSRVMLPFAVQVQASQKVSRSGPSSVNEKKEESDDNMKASSIPPQELQECSEVKATSSTQEEQLVALSSETDVRPPECGGWGGLLASVCESVAPVAQNNRSESPTKNVTIGGEDLTSPFSITAEIARKQLQEQREEQSMDQEKEEEEDNSMGLLATAGEVVKTAALEGQEAAKEWFESTLNDPRTKESAENFGQTLSDQIDNLLKIALNSEDPRGAVNKREKGIPEVVPLPNFSCSLPTATASDRDSAMTNSSEDLPYVGRCSTITPNNITKTSKKVTTGNKVWRKPPVQSLRAVSMGKAKQPLGAMNSKFVGLPPREKSRARLRKPKIPIARKKGSLSKKSKGQDEKNVEL